MTDLINPYLSPEEREVEALEMGETVAPYTPEPITIKSSQPLDQLTAIERRQGYRLALVMQRYNFGVLDGSLVVRDRRDHDSTYRAISETQSTRLFGEVVPQITPTDAKSLYQKLLQVSPLFDHQLLQVIRLGSYVYDCRNATLNALDTLPDSTGSYAPSNILWSSPYTPDITNEEANRQVDEYLLSLANGSAAVAQDILTSIAVTFITPKPRGVFWWIGGGRNGKSVLMRLLSEYIFPNQVSQVGLTQLESGRGVGDLNSSLMNISTEAGDGYVEDATNYKHLGDHESFKVKQLWYDAYLTIRGDVNCIYAVNALPDFKEKTLAISSRTFVIEFNHTFEDDPNFAADTFTPEFISAFLAIVLRQARKVYEAGGHLSFSEETELATEDFAANANSAANFLKSFVEDSGIGFKTIGTIHPRYMEWHRSQGVVSTPLGIKGFSQAARNAGFRKRSLHDNKTVQPWFLSHISIDEIRGHMSGSLSGIYYSSLPAAEEPTQLDLVLTEESNDQSTW